MCVPETGGRYQPLVLPGYCGAVWEVQRQQRSLPTAVVRVCTTEPVRFEQRPCKIPTDELASIEVFLVLDARQYSSCTMMAKYRAVCVSAKTGANHREVTINHIEVGRRRAPNSREWGTRLSNSLETVSPKALRSSR
jgi:hypothetical protein